ncbi:MAG: biotin synthase BioB [Lentisphaeria bacterium]
MTDSTWSEIEDAAATGHPVSEAAARAVLDTAAADLPRLFAATAALRQRRFGNRVQLCSILNARCGACSEDCAFCAQAACHGTPLATYGLADAAAIRAARADAAKLPVCRFGVVTSGGTLNQEEVEQLAGTFRSDPAGDPAWCGSFGGLSQAQLAQLKAAGMVRFHHNLETARSFFPRICTTHTYDQRLATLRAARAAGLELCSGGILGMGESPEQRVELALALAAERVESIPLNFLVAIPGTPLAGRPPLPPLEILRGIAMFRLVNPGAEIKVCAGRLLLRNLQSMIFHAGASGIMIGRLLTVAGRDPALDLQLLHDLELTPSEN